MYLYSYILFIIAIFIVWDHSRVSFFWQRTHNCVLGAEVATSTADCLMLLRDQLVTTIADGLMGWPTEWRFWLADWLAGCLVGGAITPMNLY